MKPSGVYTVLRGIGASLLHHANTVPTSCTFLEQGALLSRGYVEDHGLTQTPQYSDEADKKYGIWHRVFLDHVDIHYRGGRKKGPNQYGPVLFVLNLDVLLKLPTTSEVLVTKLNPVHWKEGQAAGDRYYLTAEELAQNISFGDFDKMLVINTPTGTLNLPGENVRIYLDDPQRKMSSGKDAYIHAEARLKAAATAAGIKILIEKHPCQDECACVKIYSACDAKFFDSRFR